MRDPVLLICIDLHALLVVTVSMQNTCGATYSTSMC